MITTYLNEKETRKQIIDPQLEKMGWKGKYLTEINSVKSDFVNHIYHNVSDAEIEKGVDKYIDYCLLDNDNLVLAIIEAKKYTKNPQEGRVQARSYVKDIESQTKTKIPIFLTSGQKWILIDQDGIEREISGPFSQEDLKRRIEIYKDKKDLVKIESNTNIINRSKLIYNLKVLQEHFKKGHKQALIQMATGTGKTRLAMALIDVLIKANYARKVLFVVDRISLANQAKDALANSDYFKEPVVDLREDKYSRTGRFYVSTIQTLMSDSENKKKLFETFSPGFFDLIIYDEAHRSIYDRNNLILKYFDSIKVGLTATPRNSSVESRNTYGLFGCENETPTVEYTYNEAVKDEVLVPYKGKVYETEVLALGIKGEELDSELKDQLRKQEENPDALIMEGSKFAKVFMDNKTNELIIREFLKECYTSADGLPCKTIFFCVTQNHAKKMKEIFGKVSPDLSNEVQVIISDEYRASDEIKRFKKNSEPRIAISVGILDTGVDIPEVCNLVFCRPVISSIRFWQMVGRGTRNQSSCKHPDWLPVEGKTDFKIMDFAIGRFSNLKFHNLEESKDKVNTRNIQIETFNNRVKLLKEKLTEDQRKLIVLKIKDDINQLNEDSFIVREHALLIAEIKQKFDLDKYISKLESDISPLMILSYKKDPKISEFILQVEKLFSFILRNDKERIDKIKNYIFEKLENILDKDLTEINNKRTAIGKILQDNYWEDLTFDSVEFIIKEIAPLVKYYEKDPRKLINIDKPDQVLNTFRVDYITKEDPKFVEFISTNPLLAKIKDGSGITSDELLELEREFMELNPNYNIYYVQKKMQKDFLVFIREIVGIANNKALPDPQIAIKKQFDDYIIASGNYSAKQIEYLQILKEVFAQRKRIDLPDFAEDPLKGAYPKLFDFTALQNIVYKCKTIKMM